MRAEVVQPIPDAQVYSPPIRIRTVLLLIVLTVVGFKVYPRARAAWHLHSLATAVADYALCMVGPTGPSLIRDNPHEFEILVRRRLVAAPSESEPFLRCAELARSVTDSESVAELHRRPASDFREYRQLPGRTQAGISLEEMRVGTEHLAETSRQAWPFVRGGYTRLVKPSLSANEAVHPVAPAAPAVGSGLPDWRARYRAVHQTQSGFVLAQGQGANLAVYESRDAGLSWRPVPSHVAPSDYLERCPIDADGRSFTFGLSDDGASTMVNSLGPDGAPYATPLAPARQELIAAACDADGMVVLLRSGKAQAARVLLCPFRRGCSEMHVPLSPVGMMQLSDVARVRGTTVIASSDATIVRVVSSRDGGRSWTPESIAYDGGENQRAAMGLPAPNRLLCLDNRLILYGGGARSDQAYLVLTSDDYGASWRTP